MDCRSRKRAAGVYPAWRILYVYAHTRMRATAPRRCESCRSMVQTDADARKARGRRRIRSRGIIGLSLPPPLLLCGSGGRERRVSGRGTTDAFRTAARCCRRSRELHLARTLSGPCPRRRDRDFARTKGRRGSEMQQRIARKRCRSRDLAGRSGNGPCDLPRSPACRSESSGGGRWRSLAYLSKNGVGGRLRKSACRTVLRSGFSRRFFCAPS